jgi:hypothetical protein
VRYGDDAFHFDDAVVRGDHRMTTRGAGGQVDEIAENAIAKCVMGDLAHTLVLIGSRTAGSTIHSLGARDNRHRAGWPRLTC